MITPRDVTKRVDELFEEIKKTRRDLVSTISAIRPSSSKYVRRRLLGGEEPPIIDAIALPANPGVPTVLVDDSDNLIYWISFELAEFPVNTDYINCYIQWYTDDTGNTPDGEPMYVGKLEKDVLTGTFGDFPKAEVAGYFLGVVESGNYDGKLSDQVLSLDIQTVSAANTGGGTVTLPGPAAPGTPIFTVNDADPYEYTVTFELAAWQEDNAEVLCTVIFYDNIGGSNVVYETSPGYLTADELIRSWKFPKNQFDAFCKGGVTPLNALGVAGSIVMSSTMRTVSKIKLEILPVDPTGFTFTVDDTDPLQYFVTFSVLTFPTTGTYINCFVQWYTTSGGSVEDGSKMYVGTIEKGSLTQTFGPFPKGTIGYCKGKIIAYNAVSGAGNLLTSSTVRTISASGFATTPAAPVNASSVTLAIDQNEVEFNFKITITPPADLGGTTNWRRQARYYLDAGCTTPDSDWIDLGDVNELVSYTNYWEKTFYDTWVKVQVKGKDWEENQSSTWIVSSAVKLNKKGIGAGLEFDTNGIIVNSSWDDYNFALGNFNYWYRSNPSNITMVAGGGPVSSNYVRMTANSTTLHMSQVVKGIPGRYYKATFIVKSSLVGSGNLGDCVIITLKSDLTTDSPSNYGQYIFSQSLGNWTVVKVYLPSPLAETSVYVDAYVQSYPAATGGYLDVGQILVEECTAKPGEGVQELADGTMKNMVAPGNFLNPNLDSLEGWRYDVPSAITHYTTGGQVGAGRVTITKQANVNTNLFQHLYMPQGAKRGFSVNAKNSTSVVGKAQMFWFDSSNNILNGGNPTATVDIPAGTNSYTRFDCIPDAMPPNGAAYVRCTIFIPSSAGTGGVLDIDAVTLVSVEILANGLVRDANKFVAPNLGPGLMIDGGTGKQTLKLKNNHLMTNANNELEVDELTVNYLAAGSAIFADDVIFYNGEGGATQRYVKISDLGITIQETNLNYFTVSATGVTIGTTISAVEYKLQMGATGIKLTSGGSGGYELTITSAEVSMTYAGAYKFKIDTAYAYFSLGIQAYLGVTVTTNNSLTGLTVIYNSVGRAYINGTYIGVMNGGYFMADGYSGIDTTAHKKISLTGIGSPVGQDLNNTQLILAAVMNAITNAGSTNVHKGIVCT